MILVYGLRATPIGEAMLAIVLMDHFLRNRAQNSDVSIEDKRRLNRVKSCSNCWRNRIGG